MFRTLIRRYLLELHLEPFLEIDKRIIDCINSDKCIFLYRCVKRSRGLSEHRETIVASLGRGKH